MDIDSTVSPDQDNSARLSLAQKTSQIMCQLKYDLQQLSQTAWTNQQRRQLDRLQLSLDQLNLISSNQRFCQPDQLSGRRIFCLTGLLAAAESSGPDLLAGKKLRFNLERGLPLYLYGDAACLRQLWRNLLCLIRHDPRSRWLLCLRTSAGTEGKIILHLELTSRERQPENSIDTFWLSYLEACCRDLAGLDDGTFSLEPDGYQLRLCMSGSTALPLHERDGRDERLRQLRRGRILLLSSMPLSCLHLARLLDSLALRVDLCDKVVLACGMIEQAAAEDDPYTLCIADWQGALFLELAQTLARQPGPGKPEMMLSLKPEDWPLLPLDYITALLPAQLMTYVEQPCSLDQLLDGLRQRNLIYAPAKGKAAAENLIDPELGQVRTASGLRSLQNVLLRLNHELPLLLRGLENDDPAIYQPALQTLEEIGYYIGARPLQAQVSRIRKMIEQAEPEPGIREQRRQLLAQLKHVPASVQHVCGSRDSLCQLPDRPAERMMLDRLHWLNILRQIEDACRCQNRQLAETAIGAAFGQRMRHSWQQALELMYRLLTEYEFDRICHICQQLQAEDDAVLTGSGEQLKKADRPWAEGYDDEADDLSG